MAFIFYHSLCSVHGSVLLSFQEVLQADAIGLLFTLAQFGGLGFFGGQCALQADTVF